MEKITVIGPFNAQMKECIARFKPAYMELNYITSYEEYASLKDADYVILRTLRMDAEHIDSLVKTKLIQRWGAGFDTVDIEYAGSKGIKVAACLGVNAQSVAELAVGLVLNLYRNLKPLNRDFEAGVDSRIKYSERAYCVENKTVAILGMGNIGKRVAKMLQAMGANIVYYDVFRMKQEDEEKFGFKYMEIDEAIKAADIISLHLPLLEDTKDIINEEKIAMMKKNCLLINTARAGLVDEVSLSNALKEGKILGAGLDEIKESYLESSFVGLDNVICTPHTGGSTVDINDAMAATCMENIVAVKEGKEPRPFVNKDFIK